MDSECIVTETCRHCKSAIEMRWDTGKWGFSAICPVCGRRIMLCGACRRAGDAKPCDYNRARNFCWRNPPMPRRRDTPAITLRAGTPLGAIIARTATDPNHPGIYIDLRRTYADADMPLALIEFAADEGDLPDGQPNIITRVWGDAAKEDCTYRAVHSGIEEFFAAGSRKMPAVMNGKAR